MSNSTASTGTAGETGPSSSGASTSLLSSIRSETVTSSIASTPTTTLLPSTTTSFFSTSSVSLPPTTSAPSTSVVITTPTSDSATLAPTTVTLTSISSAPTVASTPTTTTSSSTSSSSAPASLETNPSASTSQSGLSSGGKIAIAVVVPVVAVALIVFALLYLWRRRKQRKDAEELRRKEVEEYGFNPNHDPTLPNIGGTGSTGDGEMTEAGSAGYRGWGATTMARKPSTNLSSNNGGIGMAVSENGISGPTPSPTRGTASEVHSGDPLLNSPNRPTTADSETIGALGGAPAAGAKRNEINRGPSNASSSYSAGNRSEGSGENAPIPAVPHSANYYSNDAAYDEISYPHPGSYTGDGTYGGGQPVIRDVQARRNTRIENPSVVPQQGNAGIAQNF
ncbi:MAG: hypothetical protein M1838_001992 [Thelocarpon superellum]|nr:MAG: hypothetical protein M1838_001992 [Thelocarpon superellum]